MKLIFKLLLHIFLIIAIVGVIGYIYYSIDLPDVDDFSGQKRLKTVQVEFANGQQIASFGDVYVNQVQFYEIPKHLINAVIATEDQKFFNHFGVDFFAIIRAFYVNQKAGRIVQGGSTITQQLAKMLFLKPERTFKRKLQEVILAFKLEQKYTKEQIFTMYLNHAYFGSGNYGISSACKYYFKKDISQINLSEAALLAGLLKAPSKLSPNNDRELAEERANVVLHRMIDSGFLDEKDLHPTKISYKANRMQRLYFADYAFEQFPDFVNEKDLKSKKIIVKTTLNQTIQDKLEEELNKFSDENDKVLKKSQIAIVVMDKSGAILGMAGGKDYQKSQYNRAVLAKRQSGSAFKTFVYMAAFKNGYSPQDIFEDKEISINGWSPKNYDSKYFGEVTLKEAFAKSLNSVAVQLAQKLDRKEIIDIAKKLGISSPIKNDDLTIALGTTNVSLLELTTAYASIANNAQPVMPYAISEIINGKGKVLYQRESSGFDQVVSSQNVDDTMQILRSVVFEGTGKNADVAEDIHGKTGTTQDNRDAWFVGFNSKYVIGVWVGNDYGPATAAVTGGTYPAIFFARIISRI